MCLTSYRILIAGFFYGGDTINYTDTKRFKVKKNLEPKRYKVRILSATNSVLKKKYIVDIQRKQEKALYDTPSPTTYAIDQINHTVLGGTVTIVPTVYKSIKVISRKERETGTLQDKKVISIGAYRTLQKEYAEKTVQGKKNLTYKDVEEKRRVQYYKSQKPVVFNITEKRKQEIKRDDNANTITSRKRTYSMNPCTKQIYYTISPSTVRPRLKYQEMQKSILQKKLQYDMVRNTVKHYRKKDFTALQYVKDFGVTTVRAITSTAGNILSLLVSVTVLVCIVFLALLSSIAASPFGILLSNEAAEAGIMPLSAAVAAVQNEFTEKLELLQSADNYAEIYISGEPANFSKVVAVFAVHTTGNVEATSADVISIDDEKLERLKNVFWDMTTISARVDTRVIMIDEETSYIEKDLYIQITSKDVLEQASSYHFSKRQMDALYELLSQKILLSGLIQNASFVSSDIKAVMQSLPENLELDRKSVVEKALSLVGKVNYFWGGKSLTLGWDDNWGVLRKVTAEGSPTTGTYRLYGLDCSGFIDWAFFNASSGEYVISKGGGVAAQRANCIEISLENAQVGDLVFYEDNSHAGIICGTDDNGGLLIVHCTSGDTNTVVITNSTGFAIAGRPQYYIN